MRCSLEIPSESSSIFILPVIPETGHVNIHWACALGGSGDLCKPDSYAMVYRGKLGINYVSGEILVAKLFIQNK